MGNPSPSGWSGKFRPKPCPPIQLPNTNVTFLAPGVWKPPVRSPTRSEYFVFGLRLAILVLEVKSASGSSWTAAHPANLSSSPDEDTSHQVSKGGSVA
eukprot:scaffold21618_cov63-Attheya_sp.AAC.1